MIRSIRQQGTGRRPQALEVPLWRAVAAYRVASVVYAAVLITANRGNYERPIVAWGVLAVMAAWTVVAIVCYGAKSHRRPPLLVADLVVAIGCLLATGVAETSRQLAGETPNLPASWVAAPVMSWGVIGGAWYGVLAAALIAAGDVVLHVPMHEATLNGAVLLVLAGVLAGYIGELVRAAEARLARAVELDAAARERQRLARGIHDSVLQVLSLVRRRGEEVGGEAAELGRLAGEQEVALRTLVGSGTRRAGDGRVDLRALVRAHAPEWSVVSAPATPVWLPGDAARELAAAVDAALDNVTRHCGASAKAWLLIEDDGEAVVLSVRDDGPGIPSGRLEEAAAQGRLGVAESITGRVHDLGGTVTITTNLGEGTELELRIPHAKGGAA